MGGGTRLGGTSSEGTLHINIVIDSDIGSSTKGSKLGNSSPTEGGNTITDLVDDLTYLNTLVITKVGSPNTVLGDDVTYVEESSIALGGKTITIESHEGSEVPNAKALGGNTKSKVDDDGTNVVGGKDNSGLGGRDDTPGGGGPGGNLNGSTATLGGMPHSCLLGDVTDVNGMSETIGGYITIMGFILGDIIAPDHDKMGITLGGIPTGIGLLTTV